MAVRFIGRLLGAAEAGSRAGSVIGLLVMRAVACRVAGDREASAASLDRALALAAAEGFVRVFVDAGPELRALLGDAATRASDPASVQRLLRAFDTAAAAAVAPVSAAASAPAGKPQPLVEPLSQRELDVLRLLATDLDGPQIAAQLFVSVNTLRTHTRNIFAKLDVNSRRAAVTRATELGLLSRSR